MPKSKCDITIVGHIFRLEELKTNAGGSVAKFTLPVEHGRPGAEKKADDTTWFRCAAFGGVAKEILAQAKDKDPVRVEGTIRCRKWTDKEGKPRETWEVLVWGWKHLGEPKQAEDGEPPPIEDGDLPF